MTNDQNRPPDEMLIKMTDEEILAGDWLVDVEDDFFWSRWMAARKRRQQQGGAK